MLTHAMMKTMKKLWGWDRLVCIAYCIFEFVVVNVPDASAAAAITGLRFLRRRRSLLHRIQGFIVGFGLDRVRGGCMRGSCTLGHSIGMEKEEEQGSLKRGFGEGDVESEKLLGENEIGRRRCSQDLRRRRRRHHILSLSLGWETDQLNLKSKTRGVWCAVLYNPTAFRSLLVVLC